MKRFELQISFLTVLFLFVIPCYARYSGGDGSQGDPYLISTPEDLNDIGNHIEDFNSYFVMTNDIDMSGINGYQFKIIGPDQGPLREVANPFSGTFDGKGFIIKNLSIYRDLSNYDVYLFCGLFGYCEYSTIKNLGIEDVNISVAGDVGVPGYTSAGGLLGALEQGGKISNCYTTGVIRLTPVGGSTLYAGGLAGIFEGGTNWGTIENCFSTASVTIYNSAGNTNWRSVVFGGGLFALIKNSTIINCYATGSINAYGECNDGPWSFTSAGGLLGSGWNIGILNSYASGEVYAGSRRINSCEEADCYAGGFAGYLGGSVSNSYSTGSVTYGGNPNYLYTGGFLGNGGSTTACFWDVNTSGQTTSAGGIGKTTEEMKTLSTFTSALWDFTNESTNGTTDIWRMCTDGVDYPHLNWESPDGDLACPDGIDFVDFTYLADRWLTTGCDSSNNFCGGTDIDTSGYVDMFDLVMFAGNWLAGE